MMPLRLLLSVLLLQSQVVLAQNKVWLRGHDTPVEDFQVFLQNSSHVSYAKFQFHQLRKQAQTFQLKDKLISAQKLYLDGKKQKAMKFFNQITKLAYSAEWSKEDRRIILYAFLRSAQIQADEDKAQAFLNLARNFNGQDILPETYTDFKLFPPPLMSQLDKLQEKNLTLSPDWEVLFPQHEIVLINGQKIEKAQSLSLLPVSYRVTALSSTHRAWSRKVHLSQLVLKPIQAGRLTSGFCEKMELIPELKKRKGFQLFSKPACKTSKDIVLGIEPIESLENEKGFQQDLELSQKLNKDLEETPDKKNKWSHLPAWILVGAGVLALSLIVSLSGDKKSESEEDHVY